jgi:CO/xanthine dehydrogenase FAD-binding subunit
MLWPFDYHRPTTRKEVTSLLLKHRDSKILAGGTDLLVDMRTGVHRPAHVIDIGRVGGLREMKFGKSGACFIGACVTLNQVIEEKRARWQALRQAAMSIATYQIRNRATLAGNLCNASPAADCAPPLLVLGASVRIAGRDGREFTMPLRSFFTGVKRSALKAGQWVVGIQIPPHPPSLRTAFMKKQRIRGHDLAGVSVAGCLDPKGKKLRVAVGACAVTPLLFDLDRLYREKRSLDSLAGEAEKAVLAGIKPISDVRCSRGYRVEMVKLFLRKVIKTICA